ncbi:pentapeptide repeat-containing protein [Oscillatoria salina]|uniref:pentapeptide repeat-containing protein n=1 Tax=Oscillatoria salina TaxID=331517 RepID=UPI001CD02F49|nr:pentapeptide repeat-containing protein [Oscillatoria salina]MBZ8183002.1 NACHT domain-containing protein [Oscillatoria salina IIICB1]
MKLWRKLWETLNTEITIPWDETIQGSVEAGKNVLELAKALRENQDAEALAPLVGRLDSLLDVLDSPLVEVAGAALPFVSIATGTIKFIVEKSHKEPSLETSIALVSQAAYLESFRQFLGEHPEVKNQLENTPASQEVARKLRQLGQNLEVNGQEIEFNEKYAKETLICFHESPLAKVFNPLLAARLQESGLTENEAKIVTERVSRNTHRYLKATVAEIKDKVPRLAAVYGEGWQRDLEIYSSLDNYLQDVIAKKPLETVFDEKFTFQDIYVPLEVKPVKSGEVDEDAAAENIEAWAKNLLLDETKQRKILFIQGGPGRGKSVFCRMFADWVRRELHPIYTPILIRLRDVRDLKQDFDETLSAAVGWDFVKNDKGWLTERNTRFLFFLDGFDELLLERGASNALKQFLDQIEQFQRHCNENNERGHRVLVTGRPLALYGIERLMPGNLARVSIVPMSEEIQQQWLEKWQNVVAENPDLAEEKTKQFQQFLADANCPAQVKELAQEPLLLYLLAAMYRDNQIKAQDFAEASQGGAKVLIYESALDWVLNKQRTTEAGRNLNLDLTNLEPEDLRSILAEAGLCVVQSGREYAAIAAIKSRLEEKEDEAAKKLLTAAQESEEPLKNALAAFYLKSVAGAENSVEFFHKSFGEFLCAERMVESLQEWTTKTGKRRKTYETLTSVLDWQVYDLFGYGNLTQEIVEYVMALLEKEQTDLAVLFERLNDFYLRWSDGEFIEATNETLPQKKARHLQIERGQREVDIYAGLNVLILLLELHRYAKSGDKGQIDFHPCGKPGTDDFDETRLLRIFGYSQCLGAFAYLEILGKFFRRADLRGADLTGADLTGADLRSADLRSADLSDAILRSAVLRSAVLRSADLSDANLTGADLRSADLSEAILRSADLRSADFSETILRSADFSEANLSGANLRSAVLSDANLTGANLSDSNLSDSNLSGANLRSANLRNANLSGADLRSANLSGADLSGADLSGANLSGADLSGVLWDSYTIWSNAINLHEAENVPEGLL